MFVLVPVFVVDHQVLQDLNLVVEEVTPLKKKQMVKNLTTF